MTKVDTLLNVDQVSARTGWRPGTVRMKIWRRELPYLKLGRSIRIRESVIEKLLEDAEVPALKK